MAALKVWIGTRKGAFSFRTKDHKRWGIEGPFFTVVMRGIPGTFSPSIFRPFYRVTAVSS